MNEKMIAFLEEFIGSDYIDYEELSNDILERLDGMSDEDLEMCLDEWWILNDIFNDVMPAIVLPDLKLNLCWDEYIEKNNFIKKFKNVYYEFRESFEGTEVGVKKEKETDLLGDSCVIS